MQPSPVRIIEIIAIVDWHELYLGSIWQIDWLIQDEPSIEHPSLKCKFHLASTVAYLA